MGPALPPHAFLASSDVVDWDTPGIRALAARLGRDGSPLEITARCFAWVRDGIPHSFDTEAGPVTWRASEVLRHRTGICFAKAHLLAALLRANGIAAGFGYQRLSIDDTGPPFCLHGFNHVFLEETGWHPLDARGNRPGVNTSFAPPAVSLAYTPRLPGERTFTEVFVEPLPVVVTALERAGSLQELRRNLPDWVAEIWNGSPPRQARD